MWNYFSKHSVWRVCKIYYMMFRNVFHDSLNHQLIIPSQHTLFPAIITYCVMYRISFMLWFWNDYTIPTARVWLSSPCTLSVIDHSWEKPDQEKVWTVQLASQQRHWHREHPGGPREEVREASRAHQQGVGSEEEIVLQQMDTGTLNVKEPFLLNTSHWQRLV